MADTSIYLIDSLDSTQAIKDAEIMLKMDKRIRHLEDQLRRKEAKAIKWKRRYYKLKNEVIHND